MDRITCDPDILSGKPIVKGTRISVEFVLDLIGAGMTEVQIIEEYPQLQVEDIRACILYASRNLKNDIVISISK